MVYSNGFSHLINRKFLFLDDLPYLFWDCFHVSYITPHLFLVKKNLFTNSIHHIFQVSGSGKLVGGVYNPLILRRFFLAHRYVMNELSPSTPSLHPRLFKVSLDIRPSESNHLPHLVAG